MNATPSVSYFVKLYLSTSQSFTLEEIIILIRTRRWIHEITAYRTALASGDKEAARSLKAQLPGFTPSGLFKGGHRANQLEAYSQVVGLDFDHVADLAALIALFLRQPFTLALFISPGGEGLKVFVRVDTAREEHAAAFAAVAAHYEHLSGVFCDRACKDISRCCYVSDDPEAFYNPEAQVFSPASVVQGQVFVHDWLRAHPAVEGSRNQTVYRLGCEANRRGFDRDETASFCIPLLHGDDFPEEEIRQALYSAYQGHTDESATRPPSKRTEKDKKDTATFSGEELREQTPFLPENITTGLPLLLGDALRFYTDRREHDMAFLAACTVLSACLPGSMGNKKPKT